MVTDMIGDMLAQTFRTVGKNSYVMQSAFHQSTD